MALTEAQKGGVRHYLGYSGRWLQCSDETLEPALNAVAANASAEARIVALLVLLDATQTEIDTSINTLAKASAVGSLRIDGARTMSILRNKGTGYVAQLSNLLGVPIKNGGAFSTGGHQDGPGGGNALRYG